MISKIATILFTLVLSSQAFAIVYTYGCASLTGKTSLSFLIYPRSPTRASDFPVRVRLIDGKETTKTFKPEWPDLTRAFPNFTAKGIVDGIPYTIALQGDIPKEVEAETKLLSGTVTNDLTGQIIDKTVVCKRTFPD